MSTTTTPRSVQFKDLPKMDLNQKPLPLVPRRRGSKRKGKADEMKSEMARQFLSGPCLRRQMEKSPRSQRIRDQLDTLDRNFVATAPILDATGTPSTTSSEVTRIIDMKTVPQSIYYPRPMSRIQQAKPPSKPRRLTGGLIKKSQRVVQRLSKGMSRAKQSGSSPKTPALSIAYDSLNSQRSSISFWCVGATTGAPPSALHGNFEAMSRQGAQYDPRTTVGFDAMITLLNTLQSVSDLRNLAQVNSSVWKIFNNNRRRITEQVMRNESLAGYESHAWRHRQGKKAPNSAFLSLNVATAWMARWLEDRRTIELLLAHMLTDCGRVLRPGTRLTIHDAKGPAYQRLIDACWRIWTFCHIFGDGEHHSDLKGQIDWLKGGRLAHDLSCTATGTPATLIPPTSVLVSLPHYFAKGNRGGISEPEAAEMYELWLGISALLEAHNHHSPRRHMPHGNTFKLDLRWLVRQAQKSGHQSSTHQVPLLVELEGSLPVRSSSCPKFLLRALENPYPRLSRLALQNRHKRNDSALEIDRPHEVNGHGPPPVAELDDTSKDRQWVSPATEVHPARRWEEYQRPRTAPTRPLREPIMYSEAFKIYIT